MPRSRGPDPLPPATGFLNPFTSTLGPGSLCFDSRIPTFQPLYPQPPDPRFPSPDPPDPHSSNHSHESPVAEERLVAPSSILKASSGQWNLSHNQSNTDGSASLFPVEGLMRLH
ncbi:hypothetical protein J1605_003944 [Eschrichtius robustus]|uniref:Uncharacterized protein n=1 Tax=Eschrichtius robustus TaxID=9764 RepID=A0AB34HMQ9_ESCRO|nr:hypothetical protein J1605_003944 [Eschrichtius robustus]